VNAGENTLSGTDATNASRNNARTERETSMRSTLAFALALITAAAVAAPAVAAQSTMSSNSMAASGSMMLKPGESVMVMPNGQTMMLPAMKADAAMTKAAMPMNKCMIMMMGADHKMHMVEDMKMADGKMACAEMSKMAH
jgi:hypothetical protein